MTITENYMPGCKILGRSGKNYICCKFFLTCKNSKLEDFELFKICNLMKWIKESTVGGNQSEVVTSFLEGVLLPR